MGKVRINSEGKVLLKEDSTKVGVNCCCGEICGCCIVTGQSGNPPQNVYECQDIPDCPEGHNYRVPIDDENPPTTICLQCGEFNCLDPSVPCTACVTDTNPPDFIAVEIGPITVNPSTDTSFPGGTFTNGCAGGAEFAVECWQAIVNAYVQVFAVALQGFHILAGQQTGIATRDNCTFVKTIDVEGGDCPFTFSAGVCDNGGCRGISCSDSSPPCRKVQVRASITVRFTKCGYWITIAANAHPSFVACYSTQPVLHIDFGPGFGCTESEEIDCSGFDSTVSIPDDPNVPELEFGDIEVYA